MGACLARPQGLSTLACAIAVEQRRVYDFACRNRRDNERGDGMKAAIGDHLIVPAHHLDEPVRVGEVIEVHGPDGSPPYLVRWAGEERTALVFPGPDAHLEHELGTPGG
jgi:hypothetical protein